MTWFNEQDHQDLPADDRSLVVAVSNLLQRYEFDLPPHVVRNMLVEVNPQIDFWSPLTAFDEFSLDAFAEGESWPSTNVAIVRQRRLDVATAGVVDHYSLVADQRAHSIIDSLDGKIKNASEYGAILSWASYIFTPSELTNTVLEPVNDNTTHILQQGENLWDIGRQYNVPVNSLIAENEIDDPRRVPVGTEIYIPERVHAKHDEKAIHYEILTPFRAMHVVRPNGAKKWSFGDVNKWEDLYSTGKLYPRNTNLVIVAVAHVPIGDMTAAYYMDAVSFGDYELNGLVRYTTGFNWQHLAEGHKESVKTPSPEVAVEAVVADAMAEEDRPELLPKPAPELVIRPARPLSYKDSFTFLNDTKTAEVYLFKESLVIKEMDGRLADRTVGKWDGVRIIGTFEKDGITYGRAAMANFWYGIPMDKLELEDSLYNTDVDLVTRVVMRGRLSPSERRLAMLAKTVSNYRRVAELLQRHKQKQGEKR